MTTSAYHFKCFIVLCSLVVFPLLANAQACVDETINSLPFTVTSTTCGMVSDYDDNNACGSWMMSGEDITYGYTTGNESCLFLELSGYLAGSAGVIVTTDCPDVVTGDCIQNLASVWNETSLSGSFFTQPNTTYYITISSSVWNANCIDFDFSLSSDCPDPTAEDCLGAVNICEDYYYEENAPTGGGSYIDDLGNNSCAIVPTADGGWYTFTIQTDGILNFTLSPLQDDDYDWALFDMTNATCADLATNPDILVSCNSYGLVGVNGDTGISTAMGGTGNSNGPGDLNGPPFNADLQVFEGETYALFISNWSGTTNGYELDFGESTATFIDSEPPLLSGVNASCNSTLIIQFNEYIDCETVLPEFFNVEVAGTAYEVANIESACSNGIPYGLTFELTFTTPFPTESADFILTFEANEIADMCGNYLNPYQTTLYFAPSIVIDASVTNAACGNANGTIEVNVVDGLFPPFEFQLEGGPFQTENTFDNLSSGTYTVGVRDNNGCQNETIVEIENQGIDFTAGEDSHVCQLQYSGLATIPPGFSGLWTAPPDVAMSDPSSPNCIFTPTAADIYTLTWTITNNNNCLVSKSIEVSFNQISVAGFNITPPTCHDDCNASAQVTVNGIVNMAGATYDWSDGAFSPSNPNAVIDLCAGAQSVTIGTEDGCELIVPFEIENTSPVTADYIDITTESCPGFCDAQISIESSSATEYSFDGGETFTANASTSDLCAGGYVLVLKDDNQCIAEEYVNIAVPEGPKALFFSEVQRKSIFNPEFNFENASEDYHSSLWQFDYPDGIDFSHEENPEYTYIEPEAGDYTVMLVVTDDKGCVDTTFQTVGIFEDTWVYIPNSFTPNGDGINDIFKPSVLNVDVSDYQLEIYDRWGNTVFNTHDLHQGWDGSTMGNGYYNPPDVYVYLIRIHELETDEVREWNGMIQLVR